MIIFLWKWTGAFNLTNPLNTRMICARCSWNLPIASGENCWILSIYIWYIGILLLSPNGKGWDHSFEETWMPFTQWWFVQSLVEINQVIFKFRQCILAILLLFFLGKGCDSSFEVYPRLFCAIFVKFSVILERSQVS